MLFRSTLRGIIEEARHRRHRVYCCFVDFRKAFDTIPRARLVRHLQELGYDSEVIWAVVTLYERVTGQVRIGTSWTPEIKSTMEVKQGCPLSLILFGLFIDELETTIKTLGGAGCSLAKADIQILLYADDVVLLSSSATGLQRHLDALQVFCDTHDLKVNLGKTKVMIFNTS